MKSISRPLLLTALILFGQLQVTQAVITVLRHYQLGEADFGATDGATVTNSVDSVSGNTMSVTIGPVLYSSDVAARNTNSSLSLEFTGVQSTSAPVISDVTNNFGIEAWVKPDISGSCVVYNGNQQANGFGFIQSGTTFQALHSIAYFGTTVIDDTEEWTHVALVRSGGVSTFYLNGIPVGSATLNPALPTGSLNIRMRPFFTGSTNYNGYIDDLRVFTFAPGEFALADLLCSAEMTTPPVLNFIWQADGLVLSWLTNPPSILETTANLSLTDWSVLSAPASVNGRFTLTNAMTNANQFYRVRRANIHP